MSFSYQRDHKFEQKIDQLTILFMAYNSKHTHFFVLPKQYIAHGDLSFNCIVYEMKFQFYSNMTWFFSPIKSTDTNSALFPDISALAHFQ